MPIQPQTVGLTGVITPIVLVDPAAPPVNIIDRKDPFIVRVTISLSGPLVPFLAGQHFVTVARIESIGGGFEGQIGPAVNTTVVPVGLTWAAVIDIHCPAAASHPPGSPGYIQEGVYELAVLTRLFNVANVPLGLTGYQSLEYIEFYNSPTTPP